MAEDALRVARELAARADPLLMAQRAGAFYSGTAEKGSFELAFLGDAMTVSWPELECSGATPVPPHIAALLIYHLALTDGTAPTGKWISFAELPDGGFYVNAFRGYTGAAIVRRFSADPSELEAAVARVHAEKLPGMADRAWRIPALPRVPVALLWWDGDDEFDPRADLLFDETASHHLTTDGCAVLGSWITGAISR